MFHRMTTAHVFPETAGNVISVLIFFFCSLLRFLYLSHFFFPLEAALRQMFPMWLCVMSSNQTNPFLPRDGPGAAAWGGVGPSWRGVVCSNSEFPTGLSFSLEHISSAQTSADDHSMNCGYSHLQEESFRYSQVICREFRSWYCFLSFGKPGSPFICSLW